MSERKLTDAEVIAFARLARKRRRDRDHYRRHKEKISAKRKTRHAQMRDAAKVVEEVLGGGQDEEKSAAPDHRG